MIESSVVRPLASVAALVASLIPVLHAQQQQVPEARAEIVQLDVIVTDASGKPVFGLTREDFAVFEDKKAQSLAHFTYVEARAARGPGAPGAPAAAPVEAERAQSPGRHLVIVVDDLHIAPGNLELVKSALRRLVRNFLGPGDSAAILATSAPGAVRQLSQDVAALEGSIAGLSFRQAPAPPAQGSQMTPAQAELVLRGDRMARRLASRRLIDEPGSLFSGGASPRAATEEGATAVSAAGAGAASPEDLEEVAEREAERQARAILNDALRYSIATLHTIEDVLRSLSPLPGRKLCLLVSDGFLVGTGTSEERAHELRGIVDAATRSGAVVYAVDSKGLQGSIEDASVPGAAAPAGLPASVDRQAAQLTRTTLETLAADTGGFLISGTNAFDAGLGRMLAENDAYYLMAYEPTNRKRDGKFRRIEVKLPRHPVYTVRTRRGYLAPDDKAPARIARRAAEAAPPAGPSEAEARGLLAASRGESALPVRLSADYVELPPAGSGAIVRAHVDVTALAGADAVALTLDLLGGVYDAEGRPIGSAFGRRAELDATALADARRDGLQLQQRLALRPGRYEIRFAARGGKESRLGGASQWVDIPDLESGDLALSAVFLSASTPGSPVPALRDVQALRRLRTTDTLVFQVYVYNLSGERDGASDAVLQAQLRQDQKLVAASQPQPIRPERKEGALLPQTNGMPLEGLAPGRYELRVVVVDKKSGVTASRQVDFTIE